MADRDIGQGLDRGIFGALTEWVRRTQRLIDVTATRLILRIPAGGQGGIEFTSSAGAPVVAVTDVWAMDASGAPAVTIANNATINIGAANSFAGLLLVHDLTSHATALFLVGNVLAMAAQTTARFATGAGGASTLNVYLDGAHQIVAQNKTGAGVSVRWQGIRLGAVTT